MKLRPFMNGSISNALHIDAVLGSRGSGDGTTRSALSLRSTAQHSKLCHGSI